MPFIKSKGRGTLKSSISGEVENSGMADHIWKEKGNHLHLWDQAKIIGKKFFKMSNLILYQMKKKKVGGGGIF